MTTARKRRRRPSIAPAPDLAALGVRWHTQAREYDRDGVPGHAALLHRVAGELEAALASRDNAPLTL